MKKSKRIISMGLSLLTAVSLLCVNASALTYKVTTYKTTNGGQKIKITARGYTDTYEPSGGVHVYTWGVRGQTPGYNDPDNYITTTFTINGKAYYSSSYDTFGGSGTGESLTKTITSNSSTKYSYIASTVNTSSSIYGTSTQGCNFNS